MRTFRRGSNGSDPRAEVRDLRARLARLEGQLGDGPEAEEATDERGPVSRRRLLGMAGAAAAGAAGATIMAASPAAAHDVDDVQLGVDSQSAGGSPTGITSSSPSYTIHSVNSGNGHAIQSTGGAGAGVYGEAATGPGIYGFTNSGNSVEALAPGAQHAGAHLKLDPGNAAGPPVTGTHSLGQFWMDSNGVLFNCIVAGSPGKWARQSSLVSLPAPFRVYDSRVGQTNPSGSDQGTLNFGGGARLINASPVPVFGSGNLPPTTTAILFNMTLANTVGAVGSVVLWANGASEPTTASITWTGSGVVVGNAVTSTCDPVQQVQMKCTTGSSTHVILDVIGFYV